MKGNHHVIIQSKGLKYEFDIKRNITVVRGDSATGKTTLVNMIKDYTKTLNNGIIIQSDVPCDVFSGSSDTWETYVRNRKETIIFVDEDIDYMSTVEFAETIKKSDNYYVLFTRNNLRNLPYSTKEIYGIRTSGKYHFPEQVYHEFYPIYPTEEAYEEKLPTKVLLVEDEEAGFQFYDSALPNTRCVTSKGNSGIYKKLKELQNDNTMVTIIADGAAFGAFISDILNYAKAKNNIALYLPESFEWMVLKSGVINSSRIAEILDHPEDYIDSSLYFSWERFFTQLLVSETSGDMVKKYNKDSLSTFYKDEKQIKRILEIIPTEIMKCLL